MKKMFWLLCFVSLPALAGNEVDIAESASATGHVRLVNLRGELDITGWDRSEVSIKGELDDLAERLVFEVNGQNTLIEIVMPNRVGWGDGSALELHVPRGSKLSVETVSAEVKVQNVKGGVRVNSISGNIDLMESGGRLLARTASGDIRVKDCEGNLQAVTASGELDIKGHHGSAVIESVSGDVELETTDAATISVNNVSGAIDARVGTLANATVDLKTISGDIELKLVGEPDCDVTITTNAGDINNKLTGGKPQLQFGMQHLMTTLGRGGMQVNLRSVSGDIRVE